ncbi:MAG: hypothetical protein Q8P29_00585 [Candidatus Levybacteria bacterium]|nr:hypothetical protein [Candidatus Levybacteria bacterium]MDZ4227734.1 hypothetical protein [Candidatus Levybacteria bacterium]
METGENPKPTSHVESSPSLTKNKPEILGYVGDLEINGYPDTVAEKHAIDIRNEVLENFGKYSGDDPKILEFLMKGKAKWVTNPLSPYIEAANTELIKGDLEPVAASAWDVNGCLMENRDGFDQDHTFHPELQEAIGTEIDRLGSFIMVSALTGDQMSWHMAKEEKRAEETGEKSLAENIIMSAENGRSWLIPHVENGKTVITEYRLPLSEKLQNALTNLKGKVADAAQVLRSEGMTGFVNEQKFSKCTMEGSKNGREWYRETIEKVLLPYLSRNGAVWDGDPEKFALDGVQFAISPTGETWEIEITEGADRIGKRFAREILHNTITDILSSRKKYGLFKMITGGDSVKWGGSDAGLTDPNAPTIPFVIQSSEKPANQSLDVINEAIELKRKYWPTYIVDGENTRLAGPGVAPARFMQAIAETVPHLKIPTEEFSKYLVHRLTNIYGFEKYKEYPLESDQLMLYDFPEGVTPEQQQTFLKAKSDLPVPANDEEKINGLIDKINHKLT